MSQEMKDCGGERLGATTGQGGKQPQETVSPSQPGLVTHPNQGERGEEGRLPLGSLLWKTGEMGSHTGSPGISTPKGIGRQSSQRAVKWLGHFLQLIKAQASQPAAFRRGRLR